MHCPGRGDHGQDWNRGSGDEEKWEVQGTFWEEPTRTPWCSVAICGGPRDRVHGFRAEPDSQQLSF